MQRKQFINQLLVGGSGLLISSTFLYGCFKTDGPLSPPTRHLTPFIPGDVFLLASGIRLIRDEAFARRFHCEQVATGHLLSIIRKAPFPFDRRLQRVANARSSLRGQTPDFSITYHYSHGQATEYAITDVRRLLKPVRIPIIHGAADQRQPAIRLLDHQDLAHWFDQRTIDLITNT